MEVKAWLIEVVVRPWRSKNPHRLADPKVRRRELKPKSSSVRVMKAADKGDTLLFFDG